MTGAIIDKLKRMPPDQQVGTAVRMMRELYKRSLYLTSKYLLGYKDVNWRTHGEMIRSLEDPTTDRKLIVMPRGTFKSSVVAVSYPIWRLLNDPNRRILIDSEVYTNSKKYLREVSLQLQSPPVTSLFGNFVGPIWNEGEIIIAQRTKVFKEASVTASGIGAEKTGQHYDEIIMDDLNSPTNSNTPEAREKVISHYRYNMAILEPNGIAAVVGTRYAANDVIGFVLKNEIGITRDRE